MTIPKIREDTKLGNVKEKPMNFSGLLLNFEITVSDVNHIVYKFMLKF